MGSNKSELLKAIEQFVAKHGMGAALTVFLAYEFHSFSRWVQETVTVKLQVIITLLESIKRNGQ